jgi:hypothetical protein
LELLERTPGVKTRSKEINEFSNRKIAYKSFNNLYERNEMECWFKSTSEDVAGGAIS